MTIGEGLSDYCARAVKAGQLRADVGSVIEACAGAAIEIAALVSRGPLAGSLAAPVGKNSDGDTQKELDLRTHQIVAAALHQVPVAALLSEESEQVEALDPKGTLVVAVDPLDGSSNIETNIAMGTIFSVLPADPSPGSAGGLGPFGGTGERQLAAGFFLYGHHTALILTFGQGVDIFTLDPAEQQFRLTRASLLLQEGTREYAINASNRRHWDSAVRVYIDDCLNGSSGLRGNDFNMRWHGSMVAEAFRILSRGGIYLYPGDSRPGYEQGRLRLLYEAAPIAFLVEQAGGMASTGRGRILDLVPTALHQRVPLIFGSCEKVQRLERLYKEPGPITEQSPLFAARGLFRT